MVLIGLPQRKINYSIDGYLHTLLSGFKKIVHEKNASIVMIIDGRSGMGKTTLANQVGMFLDNTYDLNKVFYDPESFLEGLSIAKKGDFLLFDEAMLISSRSALSRINKMIIQAMSMIRSKNLFICFCVNSIFDLDRNLALSRADLLLHVYGDNIVDRGNFCAFFKAIGQEDRIKVLYLLGKKFYSYSKPKANFFGSFGIKFLLDEKEYERRKQIGVNKFLLGEKGYSKKDEVIVKLIKYLKEEVGLKQKEIAEISGYSFKTIYNKLK